MTVYTLRTRPQSELWAVQAAVKILERIAENDYLRAGIEGTGSVSFSGYAADDVAELILEYSRQSQS